jgi:hypothetical protein
MVPEVRRKRLVQKSITVPGNLARACDEFNAGLFYECHESLEEIWQEEHGPVRDLYKGLIQAAAAFVHLSRGNYPGAERLCRTALGYLEPYREPGALGFDVNRIAAELEDACLRIQDLGPQRIREFDLRQRPVFAFDPAALSEEAVRWRAWGFDAAGNAETKTITVAE